MHIGYIFYRNLNPELGIYSDLIFVLLYMHKCSNFELILLRNIFAGNYIFLFH